MRSNIENWELLMIRQCKKNNPSIRNLRRIYAHSRAMSVSYYKNNFKFINHALLQICLDFDLIHNINQFITVEIHPDKDKWWSGVSKTYDESLCDALISVIMCSEIKKFPRYPRSAWFRNKYPKA